jgi:hypothetical protein
MKKKSKKKKNYNKMRKAVKPEKSNMSGTEYNNKYWGKAMWNLP